MNRAIYCFVFLGLPCFALTMSTSGIRTVGNRDAVEDALKLTTGERNLFARYSDGGYRSNNDILSFRHKRADDDEASAGPDASSSEEPAEAPEDVGEPLTELRWITYLFVLAIALLFLLLSSVVLLLAYYILSTRVLNKTTCKEIELQCQCDDCDKEDNDDC